MNQAYSRLSTTHGHITDCKLLVCMYWTRLVLVRPAASLYSLYTFRISRQNARQRITMKIHIEHDEYITDIIKEVITQ